MADRYVYEITILQQAPTSTLRGPPFWKRFNATIRSIKEFGYQTTFWITFAVTERTAGQAKNLNLHDGDFILWITYGACFALIYRATVSNFDPIHLINTKNSLPFMLRLPSRHNNVVKRSHINVETWLKYESCTDIVISTLKQHGGFDIDMRSKLGWQKVVVSTLIQRWNEVVVSTSNWPGSKTVTVKTIKNTVCLVNIYTVCYYVHVNGQTDNIYTVCMYM